METSYFRQAVSSDFYYIIFKVSGGVFHIVFEGAAD
jgi:hypothetical protein